MAKSKNINPHKVFDYLCKNLEKGLLTPDKEEKYAQFFRFLEVRYWQGTSIVDGKFIRAFQQKLLENIRCQFPSVTDEEYKMHNSVGAVFLARKQPKKALPILLREARVLSHNAQYLLSRLYNNDDNDGLEHNPRILAFFKETALEGYIPNQHCYGTWLLYGMGTKKNIKEGLYYLDLAAQTGYRSACLNLAHYYEGRSDVLNVEKYLQLGIQGGSIQAMYTLAWSAAKRKKYDEALLLCTECLERDSECPGAKFVLGVMYVCGCGVQADTTKGFLFIQEAAEKLDAEKDRSMKALAYAHLGQFYKDGFIVEKSLAKAAEYFEKVEDLECTLLS